MERILVLTDFSDIAKQGLEGAVRLAQQLGGAEILLLNTELSPQGREFSATGDIYYTDNHEEDRFMVALIRKNTQRLQELAASYENSGVRITPYIEVGPMQEVVDAFMNKHKPDLIVMGTSGENTFEEYFVGNHTEQVIRIARVPVITIKVTDRPADIRNIVLATDMNDKAYNGLRHIKVLADKLRAHLHLVYVTKSGKVAQRRSDVEAYAAKQGLSNYTIGAIEDSDTEDGIKRYAASVGADLIAVITHGREGLSALLSHSVAEDVIREASVPVLTVNMNEAVKL
ncbi:universal stress protein [Cesiribacter sp. SM1]|uniref:universal stress protein n=1 Tax=Cesiribacter sp. SM1 TaxID=2861196 RepID=UPI001CD251B7|nr:universal stress protein [Cesiribacter sp. SM1]